MTVASETSMSGPYNGNGVTMVFGYDFRVLAASHLHVVKASAAGVEQTLILDIDYTVNGVGDAGGGDITLSVAPVTGQTLTIIRDVPFTQEVDLENQGAYYAETVERALDLATMRDQQLAERLSRAIVTRIGVPPLVFPPAQDGALIGWDNDGELENKPITLLTDAVEAAEAARDEIAGMVASLVPITDHLFAVALGQTSVTIPGGYDVVAYVFLEGLRISGWSAAGGSIVTFPAITEDETGGEATVDMIVGAGNGSVYAFDTLDGGLV